MGKYFARYKGFIVGTLSVNILSAIFNVVSFSVLMPILEILFETKHERYVFMAWDSGDIKDGCQQNRKNQAAQRLNTDLRRQTGAEQQAGQTELHHKPLKALNVIG